MGCDTKGIIATNKKDVREIANALLEAIREIPANPDKDSIFNGSPNLHVYKVWYDPHGDFFTINFKDGDDKRTLWVFLDCDSDDKELCDSKIILSFGMWGNSESLMKKFLKALEHLGDTYFKLNDCGDEDWEKLS
jgi:hypothetical protein